MGMIFQREHILDCLEEAMPLVKKHYEEIAWNREKIPLKIDAAKYDQLDKMGMLYCFTAREAGRLVGYAVFFVHQHLHYSMTNFAVNDIIFIDPRFRGRSGTKFIMAIEEELKALGVDTITYHVKATLDWGSLLRRKGFTLVDYIYQKWIGK